MDQMRAASELLAQRVMERVVDLVVQSLDVNEIVRRVDVNALLSRVDPNVIVEKVDLDRLLSRVDVQALIERVDIDAIVQHTDIGAVVVMSSGHMTGRAVDELRGQGVRLDDWIDRRVRRLLRRGGTGRAAPPALFGTKAGA